MFFHDPYFIKVVAEDRLREAERRRGHPVLARRRKREWRLSLPSLRAKRPGRSGRPRRVAVAGRP